MSSVTSKTVQSDSSSLPQEQENHEIQDNPEIHDNHEPTLNHEDHDDNVNHDNPAQAEASDRDHNNNLSAETLAQLDEIDDLRPPTPPAAVSDFEDDDEFVQVL